MADVTTPTFECAGCAKRYPWKPQLAGKRAKCKCGTTMTIPQSVAAAVADDDDGAYDLADDLREPGETDRTRVGGVL